MTEMYPLARVAISPKWKHQNTPVYTAVAVHTPVIATRPPVTTTELAAIHANRSHRISGGGRPEAAITTARTPVTTA